MKYKFLKYLIDPLTKEVLEDIDVFEEVNGEILSGIINNKKDWYPIIRGIPRMLVLEMRKEMLGRNSDFYKKYQSKLPKVARAEWEDALKSQETSSAFDRHQRKTVDSFAYEWDQIYEENDFERNNFLHFVGPFINEKEIKNKKIIDIGCGSGRFTKWPALMGAKVVFGTDLGDSVEVAYRLTNKLENVCIVQSDIYHMPFKNQFDIAYSIGVIHHLPNPELGFLGLKEVLKKNGQINIWVYNRRNNNRALYFYEPLRMITRNMPKWWLYKLCYIPGAIVHVINQLTILLNRMGRPDWGKKIPFFYYANFSFNMKLNDAFDVLATPKSNYYYVEEIGKWFRKAGLKNIRTFEHPEAGLTCIGDNKL